MKFVKAISLVVVVGACFSAGLYGGPLVREVYAGLFPKPAYTTGDFSQLHQSAGEPVVLFSTSTCPFCKKTRALFAADKVEYKDYLIDKSKSAEAQFRKLGGSGVPLIYIGDRRIVGYDKTTIEASLAKLTPSRGSALSPK